MAAVVAIQWPLWFGHGGWIRAHDLARQLAERQSANAQLRARNQAMVLEIASLREGGEAVEEVARGDLRMMRANEMFFQYRSGVSAPEAAIQH